LLGLCEALGEDFQDVTVRLAGGSGHAYLARTVAGGVGAGAEACHLGGLGAGGSVGEFGVKQSAVTCESAAA
jgi:hypothetical protein